MPRMTSVGESKLFGENATRRGGREKREHLMEAPLHRD